MRNILIIIVVFALGVPSIVHGEFYSYRDANGVLHFTDTIVETPEDQNVTIRRHAETTDAAVNAAPARSGPPDSRNTDSGKITLETRAHGTHHSLNRRKSRLQSEYDELIAAQRKLKKKAETVHTFSELQIYNENASQLNRKIQDFEKRRRAYEAAVKTFLDGN